MASTAAETFANSILPNFLVFYQSFMFCNWSAIQMSRNPVLQEQIKHVEILPILFFITALLGTLHTTFKLVNFFKKISFAFDRVFTK